MLIFAYNFPSYPQHGILKPGPTLVHPALHQSNILVDGMCDITGVVDWKYAGYYRMSSVVELHGKKTYQPQDWYDMYN